ncbi:MAG: EAL domain-containing response regulator [Thalassobaculum sp.]|uniref:EAL domain-containing response regulator n=1 Tax=Thalassobaculum sp. TaxID=2022740 RepID=UPI0032EEE52E
MLKVLVIDDEPDYCEFVSDVLDELGHDARSAINPDQFADRFLASIDVCFVDLFMPGMDGIEIVRFLSENQSRAAIVFMSGKDLSILHAARELAVERGLTVLGVLPKPFGFADVERVLERYPSETTRQAEAGLPELSVDDVRIALAAGHLWLAYQPKIRLSDRCPVGSEALLRWHHPERGVVGPGTFIPMLEHSELIAPVTEFVIDRALRDLASLSSHLGIHRMSVNLSARTIHDLDLPERIAAQAERHGVVPQSLVLEITETAAMADVARSIDILTRLRMKGFGLSIDDFGTGYSSLVQLVRVPFDELKIDQRFVRNLLSSVENLTVTEISVLLAHKLGMRVVAEGIEDEPTLEALRRLDCDEGQGFAIARPMPFEELRTWLQAA